MRRVRRAAAERRKLGCSYPRAVADVVAASGNRRSVGGSEAKRRSSFVFVFIYHFILIICV
jgi:hypothetical protein